MNIDKLAKQIYLQNKAVGWWDDPDRCIYQTLQLVSTELAEATEGERKNLMDDHLPGRKMGEVELADALIRVLDLGGRYGWIFESFQPPHEFIYTTSTMGAYHLVCNMALCELAASIYNDRPMVTIRAKYSVLINTILETGEYGGYDIESAMFEKLEYNRDRADHKRENRAKSDGKKF